MKRSTGDDLAGAFDEVFRLVIRHLTEHGGLTFTAVMCLGRLEREGPVRLTALGAAEGVSQPSMSQLVQRLERQGLVARIRDPEDGRASLIEISDAGRALVASRLRDRHDRLAELLATLAPEDEASLRSAMRVAGPIVRRLIETARAAGAGESV
ncbi:MarR family winged helix-turn-helix transcriptional regulator [Amycolatopsis saalfeldensis]|uniref:DNA-binding transcriptional regulator, MarR family n=1 Tax=Amycolatopsis saalfeldensis TaxID=394193 RepID=A0A1H8PVD4_9PSEU|nr:MarR family transcriptional regulator [Amycolatopsis saalfeldensis]SEO45627.1 DNA-binding transcriptional regulator, MarR family [Amycolatopsis saalfeldensis]